MIKVKCAMTRLFDQQKVTSHLLPTLVNYLLFVLLAQIFVLQKWSIYISFALLCDYCFPYTVVGCPWKVCVCGCTCTCARGWRCSLWCTVQSRMALFIHAFVVLISSASRKFLAFHFRQITANSESIASPLNETHACARTFRRCCLSIHLPSWLLFVGPLISDSNSPFTLLNLL